MRSRVILWGGTVVAVGAIALWLRPRPLSVEVATVDRGAVRVELRGEGVTRARIGTHDEVSAAFNGAWLPEPLEVGDRVRRGQLVGHLAPIPLDGSAARAAVARVAAAEASARETADALTRGQRLFDAGALAAEELQHLRTAQVAAASELSAARATLGTGPRRAVLAPLSGQVLRAPEPHARTVAAGTLLMEIGDPSALDVLVDLRTEDAVPLRPGSVAELRPAPEAPPLAARVQRIEPSAFAKVSPLGVEEQRVNVVLVFDRPPTGLGVGWRIEATLLAGAAPDVVRVPVAALVREGAGWAAWVVEGGKAYRRAITVGLIGRDVAEVKAGLAPGAVVILRPEDAVKEGRRVAARPAGAAPGSGG